MHVCMSLHTRNNTQHCTRTKEHINDGYNNMHHTYNVENTWYDIGLFWYDIGLFWYDTGLFWYDIGLAPYIQRREYMWNDTPHVIGCTCTMLYIYTQHVLIDIANHVSSNVCIVRYRICYIYLLYHLLYVL